MIRSTPGRAVAAALASAAIAVLFLVAAHLWRPTLTFEMDRPMESPGFSGFFAPESDGDTTVAWTGGRATIRLPGLDRRTSWNCVLTFRGVRPPGVDQPAVAVEVDTSDVGTGTAGGEFQDLAFIVPRRPEADRATLTINAEPTFVPGGADTRELGVQVDRLACVPERWWVRLPLGAIGAAALAAGAFAAAATVVVPATIALALATLLSLGLACLFLTGGAPYGDYPVAAWHIALVASGALAAVAAALAVARRGRLSREAGVALACSAVAGLLQMLALAHPAKPMVDALFQAHRLQSVINGHYYFTQPMPSGVEFPYAIGLYVVAAPWSLVTSDLVTLLRAVVVTCQTAVGALLYLLVAREWRSPRAGVLAVILFHLVPLPYVVVGNGNLPNVFGQSVALAALVFVVARPPRVNRPIALLLLVGLVTLAFCSHVSTAALLGAVLVVFGGLSALVGGRDGRHTALALALVTVLAATASFGLYYRHFTDVFTTAVARVGGESAAEPGSTGSASDEAVRGSYGDGLFERAAVAARESRQAFGWPMLVLAGLGALSFRRASDWRMGGGLLLAAWMLVWAGLTVMTLGAGVGQEFERYAAEFLGRVCLAVYPGVAVLGALAIARFRGRSLWIQAATLGAAVWAVAHGVTAWSSWLP